MKTFFIDKNHTVLTSSVKVIPKAMTNPILFGTKFRGVCNIRCRVGGFFNQREYSGTDWLEPIKIKT